MRSLIRRTVLLAFIVGFNIGLTALAVVENFDASGVGSLPSGWGTALTGSGEPRWTVEPETAPPSAPHVLKQSGWTANPNYPLCIQKSSSLTNGFVQVHFKPVSGTNDQAAGLVWRYQDPDNYYVARANALENNVVLYKVEKGKRKSLDILGRTGGYGVAAKVTSGQWGVLRVEFNGPFFRVFLDSHELFCVRDETFAGPGSVGLWTKADSVTLFDDFRWGLPPSE